MKYSEKYDKTSPASIEAYAKRLIGMSFREVYEADQSSIVSEAVPYEVSNQVEAKRNKGNLGQLIEKHYFHYECNSDSHPDFCEAGVELKVTPMKISRDGVLSAKERLILTMIDYCSVVNEEFYTSHFWLKSKLLLLIYYIFQKEIAIRLDYRIKFVNLFTPPEQDVRVIQNDFDFIVAKIRQGKAHELSEADTLYLGACPKGSTSRDRRKQPYSDVTAMPRAFAYKNSYMTYVLNHYIVPGKTTYEPILKGNTSDTLENYVLKKISEFKNWSVERLCVYFGLTGNRKPKNLEALLTYRILGVRGNKAEEFVKANIVVKTIRIGNNGKIKESMSFPAFKFKELVEETWDDSTFGNYLRETKFLFVVYRYDDNNELHLKGAQFWNIPYEDLEEDVRKVWEQTKKVLLDGLQIWKANGYTYNNFPKASENRVSHVRPHGKNAQDTNELPDGRQYAKQCFWLNNTYVLSQITDSLKN